MRFFPFRCFFRKSNPVLRELSDTTLKELKVRAKQNPHHKYGIFEKNMMCKVGSVYDGDTVTLMFHKPHATPPILTWKSARLLGFDAPEMRGGSEKEKDFATFCRDMVRVLCLDTIVRADIHGDGDRYGRLLVNIYPDKHKSKPIFKEALTLSKSTTLNEWALKCLPGCVQYEGGKKPTFDNRISNGNLFQGATLPHVSEETVRTISKLSLQ